MYHLGDGREKRRGRERERREEREKRGERERREERERRGEREERGEDVNHLERQSLLFPLFTTFAKHTFK